MNNAAQNELPHNVMQTAADWLVRLHSGDATADDRNAIRHWCEQHPDHARAWDRAQQFLRHFERIPADIGRTALDAPASRSRRHAVNQLALLMSAGPALWATWNYTPLQTLTADYRTGIGELRELALAEGSLVMLNTDSAIEVSFDAAQRVVRLVSGEIFVKVAHAETRPLLARNRHGIARSFNAEFTLRQFEQHSRIAVFAGALDLLPHSASGDAQRIAAGEQCWFDTESITGVETTAPVSQSWTSGMLIARQMRLADLLAEFARYQRGLLRCDPAVADIRISGAFPVTNIPLSLKMLRDAFPLQVQSVTRYWTTVGPVS